MSSPDTESPLSIVILQTNVILCDLVRGRISTRGSAERRAGLSLIGLHQGASSDPPGTDFVDPQRIFPHGETWFSVQTCEKNLEYAWRKVEFR